MALRVPETVGLPVEVPANPRPANDIGPRGQRGVPDGVGRRPRVHDIGIGLDIVVVDDIVVPAGKHQTVAVAGQMVVDDRQVVRTVQV